MEPRYQILQTIFDIAGNDPQPETYQCRPRELILRLLPDWAEIHTQLRLLEIEEFIRTTQLDTMVITIRREGINKLRELASASAYRA